MGREENLWRPYHIYYTLLYNQWLPLIEMSYRLSYLENFQNCRLMFVGSGFLAVNHHYHKNWVLSILIHNLWLMFMGMKQKKNQNGRLKKDHFSKSLILNIFLWKFTGLVLGLIRLNVAKGINVVQPIWPWGCPT